MNIEYRLTSSFAAYGADGASFLLKFAVQQFGLDRGYVVGFGGETDQPDTDFFESMTPFVRVEETGIPIAQIEYSRRTDFGAEIKITKFF